jgi:N-acetylglucosaminyldiphosphoundecaprenol N-acetyl-beta-D-mannosaminyltransferase
MLRMCKAAAANNIPIGLYGATDTTLRLLRLALLERCPALKVVYTHAPPFRTLNSDEDAAIVDQINSSDCRILFVGLGCPKQEMWMAAHRGKLRAVMFGVGAAFDFISGVKKQAPPGMQRLGLEWMFRLATEPRRLWFRYLYHNPRFLALVAWQMLQRSNSPIRPTRT